MTYSQELHKTALRPIVSFAEGVGTIKDIIDIARNTTDFRNSLGTTSRLYSGSIAKRTAQLVLVFPVLVSSSIGIQTAILISKAIERKCVSLLQILLSAINLTSYKDTKDLYDYISRFHTNLDIDSNNTMSLDDFMGIMNTIGDYHHEAIVDKELFSRVLAEMQSINIAAKTALNEFAVSDYNIRRNIYGQTEVYREDAATKNDSLPLTQVISKGIEKANEIVPTMLTVNFTTLANGNPINRQGIIGVKAKFYPVDTVELRKRLASKYNDSNGLFSFIRATTGEISFWKDWVFAVDKLKLDAIADAKSNTNGRIFNLLERRANKNKSRLFNSGNASPITTLVMTNDEVEMLKKESSIDMLKPGVNKIIFDGFNLMGLVIVDDATESAKFMFDDGSNSFETISYSALNKESKDDSTLNKMVSIMQKGGRL